MRWGKIHGPGDSRVYDGPAGLSEEEREKAEEELKPPAFWPARPIPLFRTTGAEQRAVLVL